MPAIQSSITRPETRTVKASEARQQWSRILNSVFRGEARVVVEKSGIPVAAVISARDLERLTELEEQRRRDFSALEATWDAFRDVPDDELEREVSRAVAEARRQRRQADQGAPGHERPDADEQLKHA